MGPSANVECMMREDEFAALVAYGKEQFGVEFKGPGARTHKPFLAKVIRAVLGMVNRQDGGRVIIGVDEGHGKEGLVATGLTAEDLKTWTQDDLGNSLAAYTDPYVTFNLEPVAYQGRTLILITVSEFEEVPILCKRDYAPTLKDGACYFRSRRKPETVQVSSHADMRDLLELAVSKGVRKFIARAQQAGALPFQPTQPSDRQRYDEQLGDLK